MTKIKDIKSVVNSFVSEEVDRLLPEGRTACRLVNFAIIHSAMDNKGNPTEKDKEYADVTTQVYVEVASVENKGAMAHRFNIEGFLKYENLTPAEKKSGKFKASAVEGYAMTEDKDGDLIRVSCPENTAEAHNILNDAFSAMGMPAGSTIDDLQEVVDDRRSFDVKVRLGKEYNGKQRREVHYFAKTKAEAGIDVESFD